VSHGDATRDRGEWRSLRFQTALFAPSATFAVAEIAENCGLRLAEITGIGRNGIAEIVEN
jgi:hypothetical protein